MGILKKHSLEPLYENLQGELKILLEFVLSYDSINLNHHF